MLPLIAAGILIGSALSQPAVTRSFRVAGPITHIENGEWLQVSADPFERSLRYRITAGTRITSAAGERIDAATLNVGDFVTLFCTHIPGERDYFLHRVVRTNGR